MVALSFLNGPFGQDSQLSQCHSLAERVWTSEFLFLHFYSRARLESRNTSSRQVDKRQRHVPLGSTAYLLPVLYYTFRSMVSKSQLANRKPCPS